MMLDDPRFAFSLLVIGVIIPIGFAAMFMIRLTASAYRAKRLVEAGEIIGLRGRAYTDLATEGAVFVKGRLWRARSRTNISMNESIRVTEIEGLMLIVEPTQNRGSCSNPRIPFAYADDELE